VASAEVHFSSMAAAFGCDSRGRSRWDHPMRFLYLNI
jgi:hypothetical protein